MVLVFFCYVERGFFCHCLNFLLFRLNFFSYFFSLFRTVLHTDDNGLCSWDEWVPSSRLLKYNEPNLVLQKQIQASTAAATSSSSTSKSTKAGASKEGGTSIIGTSRKEGNRGKERGREEVSTSI